MRRRSVALVLVAGLLALTAPAGAQDDEPTATTIETPSAAAPVPDIVPPDLPASSPAPAGFAQRITDLYQLVADIVDDGVALGLPQSAALDTEAFAGKMAGLAPEELALLHAATSQADLAAVEETYRDLGEGTAATVDAVTGVEPERAPAPKASDPVDAAAAGPDDGATVGPRLAAVMAGDAAASSSGGGGTNRITPPVVDDVPPIDPPPGPYEDVPAVAATETLTCPELPPGPNVGNYAINGAKVATTVLKAIAEAIMETLTIIPVPFSVFAITIPNPFKAIVELVASGAEIAEATLVYLRDRYWDCGGEDMFDQAPNMDNIALQLYGLMGQNDDTISNINSGVLTVSGQIDGLHRATEDVLRLRVQQALTAPIDSPPNIAYMLPAAEGGYLDALPVGVQDLVTDAVTAALEAGLPVNSAAPMYLTLADAALDQGDYARAYVLYQKTFQNLGR